MIFPGFPGVLSFFQVEWEPCQLDGTQTEGGGGGGGGGGTVSTAEPSGQIFLLCWPNFEHSVQICYFWIFRKGEGGGGGGVLCWPNLIDLISEVSDNFHFREEGGGGGGGGGG